MNTGPTMRRMSTAVVAGAAAVAVLAPAASAATAAPSAPAAVAGVQAEAAAKKLTVSGYVSYLKTSKKPEAKQTLAQFNKLPQAKKVKFVNYLQNRGVYTALTASMKGTVNRDLRVVTPYNADVNFLKTVRTVQGKDKQRTTKVTFTVTERIYGIPVTSEQVSVKYQAKPVKPGGFVRGEAKVTNVNAAIGILAGKIEARKVIGGYLAGTRWTATPNYQSFGKKVIKEQNVTSGSGYWKAILANR